MTTAAMVALNALLLLVAVEGLARLAEGNNSLHPDTYSGRFLIEVLGGSACLNVDPKPLEKQFHRAGLTRVSVLNLCQTGAGPAQQMATFLRYGRPLAPQVVLSFGDDSRRTEKLAVRRLAARLLSGPSGDPRFLLPFDTISRLYRAWEKDSTPGNVGSSL